MQVRRAKDRGYAKFSWLESYHTFSFASYFDPEFLGFKSLRVINEDTVDPEMGFATHSHQDMEIITFMLEGSIEHKDSMGNISQIKEGEIQVMSAGSGVQHSEYNPSKVEKCRLYQIWIKPDRLGIGPSYSQTSFLDKKVRNGLTLLVSNTGEDNSLRINQNAKIYLANLSLGNSIEYILDKDRGVWIQVIKGSLNLNGKTLMEHDGVSILDENIKLEALEESEFILFDL